MHKTEILLVDDRPENLLALEGVLRAPDYAIYKAGSGQEALSLVLQHRFAVALIDVQMPEMDGFELAELIRGSGETEALPIIFVTAGVRDQEMTFKGFEAGAVDFLHKPLNDRIVRSKVRVFVELDRQRVLLEERVAEVQKAREAIAASHDELSRFAYVASHDIKEPLRMISSYLTLLQQNYREKLDAEASEYIGHAVEGAKRLASLTDSLIRYSRVGTVGIDATPSDVAQIVKEVLHDLSASIAERHATVNVGYLPTVTCDRWQIRQLFQNLISNAIKFTKDRAPEVSIRAVEEPGAWRFSVSDNGIGISDSHIQKIFEPFTRLNPHYEFAGDGIGLSVCKIIVERHHGRIRVDSTPGQGSSFSFTLPREV